MTQARRTRRWSAGVADDDGRRRRVVVAWGLLLFVKNIDDDTHEIVDVACPTLVVEDRSHVDRDGESAERTTL